MMRCPRNRGRGVGQGVFGVGMALDLPSCQGEERQFLIEKGRRILRKFCASEEGRRKLERHRARQKKEVGAGPARTGQVGDGQNTPRAIADWQRYLISPPRGGPRTEIPQVCSFPHPAMPSSAIHQLLLGVTR